MHSSGSWRKVPLWCGLMVSLFLAAPMCQAQELRPGPNIASYLTVPINPAIAVVQAFRSEHPGCYLKQLGASEFLGNVSTLLVKALVHGERPCAGCKPDGFWSGHSMNAFIGWRRAGGRWGLAIGSATPVLRVEALAHTKTQVAVGSLAGLGADEVGRWLIPCP